jgi:hypothetical protein
MLSLSVQSLQAGQKVGVLCSHGKVLARLVIEKGQVTSRSSVIKATVANDDITPRSVRGLTTINLLGAPWAPRVVVSGPTIAPARKALTRHTANSTCECTLDSPPRVNA